MKNSTQILHDLASASRDGKSFYEQAAKKVDDTGLKTLFTRIASVKGDIVQGLATDSRMSVNMHAGAMAEDFNKVYGEVRPHLGERNYAYLSKLEESESHLLKTLDKLHNDKDIPAGTRTVINHLVPEVRDCHDLLHARKIELRKAA